MLRIIQNQQPDGAKSYYSTADYYSEGQELDGQWQGKAAAMLGLSGKVEKADWDRLCDNQQPQNGEPLTLRNKSNRTVGYDFNFHVPKSVSLLYAMTRDDRILDAFRESVRESMKDIESEMQVRVRKDGKHENRTTSNMVWGEFIHFTARPVDSIPDCHLHAHCFAFNATWDKEERVFKAGQFRDLKRDAPYFEALYHSKLAASLGDLGLPVIRNAKGWEIAGLSATTLKKFSRRTELIEQRAKQDGISDPAAKAELGAKTRQRKTKELGFSELQQEWASRLTPSERLQLDELRTRLGSPAIARDHGAVRSAVDFAKLHAFERQSVVPERVFLTHALKRGIGEAKADDVLHEAKQAQLIRGVKQNRSMVTTHEVYREEQKLLQFARRGRGACKPLVSTPVALNRSFLNGQQRNAVFNIVSSRDRLILLRGRAGVGKTTLLKEAVEQIQGAGTKVLAFAPSSDASRGVLREAGFSDATTVAQLLVDKNLQAEAAGQVIWIDEAGQVGTKTLAQVIDLSERINARLLLSGDRNQHRSVERGSSLKLLEDEAGIVPAEVKEIQRQQGKYKEAVALLAEQKTSQGFETLDRLGWVRELSDNDRYQVMADEYVKSILHNKSALVVSPTHAEGEQITAAIRGGLKAKERLKGEEVVLTTLENIGLTEAQRSDPVSYEEPCTIVFHQNAKGYKKGDRIDIDAQHTAPLQQAQRFQVYRIRERAFAVGDRIRITKIGETADHKHRLDNGAMYTIAKFTDQGDVVLAENGWTVSKDFGHLTHGYCVTSHASQGKTVDTVLIGQSSESFAASSREQFYVSVSRGAKQAVIFTNDKGSLKLAIQESEDEYSAIDLVSSRQRETVLERNIDKVRDHQAEQPSYERSNT